MKNKSLWVMVATLSMAVICCVTTQFVSYESSLITQPDMSNDQNIWISDKFEIDRIVPIETTKNYVMSDMLQRVILYNDNIIILDHLTSGIFVADAYSGKIKTHINRRGRGPGESNIIRDITIDEQNEQILAYNVSCWF